LDVEGCALLIKLGGILLGVFSLFQSLYFCGILVLGYAFGSLLGSIPYIGTLAKTITLFTLLFIALGLAVSFAGVVLGIMYFKLGDRVESGYLTKRERDKWMIITVLFLVFSFLARSWLLFFFMLLILAGLILLPSSGYAEETIRGRVPGSYR